MVNWYVMDSDHVYYEVKHRCMYVHGCRVTFVGSYITLHEPKGMQ